MVKEVNQVSTDTGNKFTRHKPYFYEQINSTYSYALVARLRTCKWMHSNFIYSLLMFPVVFKAGKSSNETCCPIQARAGKIVF